MSRSQRHVWKVIRDGRGREACQRSGCTAERRHDTHGHPMQRLGPTDAWHNRAVPCVRLDVDALDAAVDLTRSPARGSAIERAIADERGATS